MQAPARSGVPNVSGPDRPPALASGGCPRPVWADRAGGLIVRVGREQRRPQRPAGGDVPKSAAVRVIDRNGGLSVPSDILIRLLVVPPFGPLVVGIAGSGNLDWRRRRAWKLPF